MHLAKDMGMNVEQRRIALEELSEFQEAGECGTAAVIAPIGVIDDADTGKSYVFSKDGKPGKTSEKLYKALRAIQYGEAPDRFNWTTILE